MDFRNFTTHAAERRRAGAILGTPPPVDGKRTGVHHCRRQVDLRPRLLHPWRKSYKSRTTASPLQENPCYNTTTRTQEPYDPGLLTEHSAPHTHAECSVINSLGILYPDLMARDGGLKVWTAQRPSSFFHICQVVMRSVYRLG